MSITDQTLKRLSKSLTTQCVLSHTWSLPLPSPHLYPLLLSFYHLHSFVFLISILSPSPSPSPSCWCPEASCLQSTEQLSCFALHLNLVLRGLAVPLLITQTSMHHRANTWPPICGQKKIISREVIQISFASVRAAIERIFMVCLWGKKFYCCLVFLHLNPKSMLLIRASRVQSLAADVNDFNVKASFSSFSTFDWSVFSCFRFRFIKKWCVVLGMSR